MGKGGSIMKRYKVKASYISTCETIVEAEDQQEAYQIAKELDGGCFDAHLSDDDWQIDDVFELGAL
jgi:hypothetical protein